MRTERRRAAFLFFSTLAFPVFADVPDTIITHMSSASGHATIAGKLVSKPDVPVGISIRNGSIAYSTVTDPEGRWGIVIRHQAVTVTVTSWSLQNSSERGKEVIANLSIANASLPWSRSVYAQESSNTEYSAKYQTETSLRYRIDRERSNCSNDKGRFSHYTSQMTCYKSGSSWSCSQNGNCRCDVS